MTEQSKAPERLTVAQAAARLGISERTLLRRIKAGTVEAEKRPIEGGGLAWQVTLDAERTGHAPDTQWTNAPEPCRHVPEPVKPLQGKALAENHETQRTRDGHAPDKRADTVPTPDQERAGTPPPPAGVIEQLRSENAFLRDQVNAWRLQAEAANRTAAETSAALRKALDAMKALPEAKPAESTSPERIEAIQERKAPERPPARQPQQQRTKLKPWQRVAARILGIR